MSKRDSDQNNKNIEWKKRERQAVREILLSISAAKPNVPEEDDSFLEAAQSVNADLAKAAEYELDGTVNEDEGGGYFELLRSPMYWTLRDAFIEAAEQGSRYAFTRAVWRAYNAGRVSSNRCIPPTPNSN
jgi:hypothetical protein